jgi:hypothetical protein
MLRDAAKSWSGKKSLQREKVGAKKNLIAVVWLSIEVDEGDFIYWSVSIFSIARCDPTRLSRSHSCRDTICLS